MEFYFTSDIAWQRTVGQLDNECAHRLTDRVQKLSASYGSIRPSKGDRTIVIALLDRISQQTATLSWSDPQGCRYGEQVWRFARAKRSGICALSGLSIAAGDAIYRPAKVVPSPANATAMMRANEFDRAFANLEATSKVAAV